ncbi:MAG: thioredoxin [Patescibacteria group bacterium]
MAAKIEEANKHLKIILKLNYNYFKTQKMALILNDENFEKEINNSNQLILVDFFAEWCEPCSVLGPILEKVSEHFKEKFVLVKVNLDSAPLIAQKFGIEKIPTVVLFKAGKPISGFVGLSSEANIKEWLEKIIESKEDDNEPARNASHSDAGGEKIDELEKEYAEYAKTNGFQLNPDIGVARRVINGLLENEKKYGKKYCPCRRVTGNEAEDSKKICPCFWHKDELEKDGHCFCKLYTK